MIRAAARLAQIRVRVLHDFLLCLFAGVAQAGTVHGTVKNGTTGKPAPGVTGNADSTAGRNAAGGEHAVGCAGQFTFDNPNLGAQPMLIRAVYHGINFHQPVPPGKSDVEVAVYEPTKDAKAIAVTTRVVFFQPNGANSDCRRRIFPAERHQAAASLFSRRREF